jgi:hypothetical protein
MHKLQTTVRINRQHTLIIKCNLLEDVFLKHSIRTQYPNESGTYPQKHSSFPRNTL